MEQQSLKGIFSVISTPFTEKLEVDYDSLRNCAQFALDSNAKGVLTTAMSAEFYTLTDEEHYRAVKTIANTLAGNIPMVVGIVSDSVEQCVAFAKHANSVGAAALNLTPPYLESTKWGYSWDAVLRFFDAMSKATDLPLFIQNSKLLGCDMNSDEVCELAIRYPNVQYIKEEGFDMRQNPSRILDRMKAEGSTTFKGVITGSGHYLIEDFRRGVSGSMVPPEFTDYYVDMWDACLAGDFDMARNMHTKIAPLIIYQNIYWESLSKYVLKKRKIIQCDAVRSTISMFNEQNYAEVDRMFRVVEPYLRVRY
jgi:4-hydroxy-tetrahydrodipicolinate synthase